MKFNQTTIIGIGLIGASLALDLRAKKLTGKIVGFDRDVGMLQKAKRLGVIDVNARDLKSSVAEADLIVIAAPVRSISAVMKQVAPHIKKGTLVIDVGSTKKNIITIAEKTFSDGNFIGCHPMAGKEKSGVMAAEAGLFESKPCLIVRPKNASRKSLLLAKLLWNKVGSCVLEMTPEAHDKAVANCSHLPHVLSFALMLSVAGSMPPAEIQKIAGASFRAYTRIAGSDANMWTDIFLENKKNILATLRRFSASLARLEKLIQSGDERKLKLNLKKSAQLWRQINS